MTGTRRVATYLALVFLSGIAVGALGYRLVDAWPVTAVSQKQPRSPEEWRRKFVSDMQARLQLSPEQTSQFSNILDDTRERYRQFRERHKAETDAIEQDQVTRVKALLKPDQIAQYEKFLEERKQHRGKHPR